MSATDGAADSVLQHWARAFAACSSAPVGSEDALPPHHPQCRGCGPDDPNGHHLTVWWDGERVRARQVFDVRHVGEPGIAHGGAVATVHDHLLG